MKRIQMVASWLLLPVGIYALVYPYMAVTRTYEMTWATNPVWDRVWTHPDAVVEASTRWLFFWVWIIPLIGGVVAVGFALRLLWLLRQGVVFDNRIACGIMAFGGMLSLSNLLHLLAAAVSPMIKSWHNPEGPLPLRFWYSSAHIGMLLYGLAFVLMGWVMYEAIRLARENEEFV